MIGERAAGFIAAAGKAAGESGASPCLSRWRSRGRSRAVVATIRRPWRSRPAPNSGFVHVAARRMRRSVATRILTRRAEDAALLGIADVAQLVEHFTRNEGFPGSSPGVGFEGG